MLSVIDLVRLFYSDYTDNKARSNSITCYIDGNVNSLLVSSCRRLQLELRVYKLMRNCWRRISTRMICELKIFCIIPLLCLSLNNFFKLIFESIFIYDRSCDGLSHQL